MIFKFFLFTLVFAFVLSTALSLASVKDWEKAPPLPLALQEIYAETYGGAIYTGGGITTADIGYTDIFLRFIPQDNMWEILKPLPARRHHVTFTATADDIYAIGGFEGNLPNWQAQSSVYVYSPSKNEWRETTSLPEARGEHISAFVNGKIYVIGGRVPSVPDANHFETHHDTKRNEVFNPATAEWAQAAPAPTARNSAAAAVIDGKIYVVGGRQNQIDEHGNIRMVNLPHLEVYDPKTDTWESRAAMPLAQGGNAAATVHGKLYVFGGEQWFPEEKLLPNSWMYDPETNRWTALPNLPTPRHGLAAASDGSDIYVFGGATVPGVGATAKNEVLRLQKAP